ncbi:MAG: hypothetical protein KDJ26_07390 [Alphaproteobacteria bacterium]|nr:hypothetical protein [Alphaproteobacteria bacterium]MCB9984127.1 hypothetical protein [Micavibrio sp.]HRK96974.1 hypothetical protein [Alphaproteobacteria bacterium]
MSRFPDTEAELRAHLLYEPVVRREPSVPQPHNLPIIPFFNKLWKSVEAEAPEWTSSPVPPYNFSKSEAFAKAEHPRECDSDVFLKSLVAFVVREAKRGCYPTQAYAGWFISVLANVFDEGGDRDFILEHALPAIWSNLIESGAASNIGGLFNPAILNNLNEPNRAVFIDKVTSLLWGNFNYKGYAGINSVVEPHIKRDQHVGVYSLNEERMIFGKHLACTVGLNHLVGDIRKKSTFIFKIHVLIDLFECLPKDQQKKLADEINRQMGRDQIIADLYTIMEGRAYQIPRPWAGIAMFTALIKSLPSDQRREYSEAMYGRLGNNVGDLIAGEISWLGGNDRLKSFIVVFPDDLGIKITQQLVHRALKADYYADDGNYGHLENSYTERSNFATALHSVIPLTYQSKYERIIIKFLESSRPQDYEEALLKASLLLRSPLTKRGEAFRTREIDFYPVRHRTTDAIAHIKPDVQERRPATITTQGFIGTLSDYFAATIRTESLGGPRWLPPHQREIHPQERYTSIFTMLWGVEEDCLSGSPEQFPSLLDALRSRQPLKRLPPPLKPY